MTAPEKQSAAFGFPARCSAGRFLILLLPALAGLICVVALLLKERRNMIGLLSAGALVLLSAAIATFSGVRSRRTVCEIFCGMIRVTQPHRIRTMKLTALDRIVMSRSLLHGRVNIRVYSSAVKRAWFSGTVSEDIADKLAAAVLPTAAEIGRTIPGRSQAFVCAATSDRVLFLISASALLTWLAGKSAVLNIAAACLLAAAAADIIIACLCRRRLYVVRYPGGCRVACGFSGERMIYVPESSIVGVRIHRTPADILLGRANAALVTSGGRIIPCARGLSPDGMLHAAMKLTGTDADSAVSLRNGKPLSGKYAAQLTASLFAAMLSGLAAFRTDSSAVRLCVCMALVFFAAVILRCAAGLKCADSFGIKLSPSCLIAGGLSMSGARYLVLKRGSIAGVSLSGSLAGRMEGLCSAEVLPGGGSPSVKCGCISSESLEGLISRFV